jgi:hypothetical protein
VAHGKRRDEKRETAQRLRAPAAAALGVAVRELADRRAIEDGLIRYAHALDTRDYGRLSEIMKADVRVKYGDAAWLDGVEAVARFCARALERFDATQHRLGTIDVTLDGDRATSTTYLCAEHLSGGSRFTLGGSYLDVWERTQEGWRIAERRLVTSWSEGDASARGGAGPPAK